MTSLWLGNLVAYSLQVTLIVGAGTLLALIFRLRASAAALIYWQALLGLCLVLPVCGSWKPAVSRPAFAYIPVEADATKASPPVPSAPPRPPGPIRRPVEQTALLVISAGILARGLWLVFGFGALARLRRESAAAPQALGPLFDDAQRQVGARADFRTSARAAAPITFGLRRPVILLPPAVGVMPAERQRAIICHELVHVRRRDWAWCVAEEFAGAMFWFHPAIWWLIGRIHLVREQVVDRAVIDLTASPEGYLDALLAVAQAKMDNRLIPAPLFLRSGLLKKRVAEIVKEKTMTRPRLILSLALSAAALFMVVRAASSLFPFRVHAQELSSQPIQVLQGGDGLVHRAALVYPHRAMEHHIEGDVALQVSVDDQGQVSDARVLSGPEELRSACLRSVLEWRYRTPSPGEVQVVVHFQLAEGGSQSEIVLPAFPEERTFAFATPTAEIESRINEAKAKLENPNTTAEERAQEELRISKLKTALSRSLTLNLGGENPKIVLDEGAPADPEVAELKTAIENPATAPEDRAKMKKQLAERLDQLARSQEEGQVFTYVEREGPVNGKLTSIRSERVSQSSMDALSSRLAVHVGDTVNEQSEKQVSETVRQQLGEQYRAKFHPTADGGVELVILGPDEP